MSIARTRAGEWIAIDGGALRLKAFQKGTIHLEIHPDMAWRFGKSPIFQKLILC